FERLFEIAGALAQFTEQARVLDGDYGLIGEGADKRDLLLGKQLDVPMRKGDDTDRLALSHQRHSQRRAYLTEGLHLGQRIFGIGSDIGDVNDLAFLRNAPDGAAAAGKQ